MHVTLKQITVNKNVEFCITTSEVLLGHYSHSDEHSVCQQMFLNEPTFLRLHISPHTLCLGRHCSVCLMMKEQMPERWMTVII
jgi:hypothetical protein